MDAAEVARQLTKDLSQAGPTDSSDEEDQKQQKQSASSSSTGYDDRLKVWHTVDPGMMKPVTDVGSLFSDIAFKHQQDLLSYIPNFDLLNPNVELRDWCTWYDYIRAYVFFDLLHHYY